MYRALARTLRGTTSRSIVNRGIPSRKITRPIHPNLTVQSYSLREHHFRHFSAQSTNDSKSDESDEKPKDSSSENKAKPNQDEENINVNEILTNLAENEHVKNIGAWFQQGKKKLGLDQQYKPPLPGEKPKPDETSLESFLVNMKGAVKETMDDFKGKKEIRGEVYVGKTQEELEAEEQERLRAEAEAEVAHDLRHGLESGPWVSAVDVDSREVYFYKKDEDHDDTTWECPEGEFEDVDWEALKTETEIQLEERRIEEEKNRGPDALVKVKKGKTNWERMTAALQSNPVIQDILQGADSARKEFRKSDIGKGARKISDRVEDTKEEIAERIETSQHPWVYTISNAWDELKEETKEAQLLRELRRIDPDFDTFELLQEVEEFYCEAFLTAFYEGNMLELEKLCTQQYYTSFLHAQLKYRKEEGITFDPTVLNVEEANVHEAVPTGTRSGIKDPGIMIVCKAEMVHCMRDKSGKIIEGGPEQVHLLQVLLYLVREYSPETNTVSWKVNGMEQGTDRKSVV